jgi:hypothetical protein
MITEELEQVLFEVANFDGATGKPRTRKGFEICAGKKDCYEKFIVPRIDTIARKRGGKLGKFEEKLVAIAQKAGLDTDQPGAEEKPKLSREERLAQREKHQKQMAKKGMGQMEKDHEEWMKKHQEEMNQVAGLPKDFDLEKDWKKLTPKQAAMVATDITPAIAKLMKADTKEKLTAIDRNDDRQGRAFVALRDARKAAHDKMLKTFNAMSDDWGNPKLKQPWVVATEEANMLESPDHPLVKAYNATLSKPREK